MSNRQFAMQLFSVVALLAIAYAVLAHKRDRYCVHCGEKVCERRIADELSDGFPDLICKACKKAWMLANTPPCPPMPRR